MESIWKRLKRKKKKETRTTIEYWKKKYNENSEYRYLVVVGKERKPYRVSRAMVDMEEIIEENWVDYDLKFPIEVIDLLFWDGKENYNQNMRWG